MAPRRTSLPLKTTVEQPFEDPQIENGTSYPATTFDAIVSAGQHLDAGDGRDDDPTQDGKKKGTRRRDYAKGALQGLRSGARSFFNHTALTENQYAPLGDEPWEDTKA
ncbi:Protein of unknown function [Pyronema omphalodes CBS 100304]|uniref:Uncharacterized protein n=1 Tax=Pyronema omphalodes (strain CBS 100304) TaxID=1076935 RepID=U4KW10_PYROM|nr:Protein of unknown function [Pyronema omphalodes CBS 100304]